MEQPEEKTPANTILTAKDRGLIIVMIRAIIRPVVPLLPQIGAAAGSALVALILSVLHTRDVKKDTDKKIDDTAGAVVGAAEKTTKRAYKDLAKPTRDLVSEVAALEARLTAAEATNKAQSALLQAREREFVIEGRPVTPARRRRVDPALVKVVAANAAKDSRDLAARVAKPAPTIAPPPPELPPAPKAAPTAPGVQVIGGQRLAPVPAPTPDAAP